MTAIDVRPYRRGDLAAAKWMGPAAAASEAQISAGDPAYTGRAPDGTVIWLAALKVQPGDPGHAVAWLTIRAGAARQYARTFAEVRSVLRRHAAGMRRITSYVDVRQENEAGRFLEHMGFVREGTLRAFGPDGRDYHVYGLIPGEEA